VVKKTSSKWIVIISLIIAGEMIFSLPFHVTRYFRPTFLDVFKLSNAALGDVFAIYGITAMLAYFPGGAIADRFSARRLITVSLILTAMGGIYMAQIPGRTGLSLLFGYWGVTSILLLWAALIRATRDWGGHLAQGKAFGLLDGGRGLVAAAAASLGVLFFSQLLPADLETISDMQRQRALQAVIYHYTAMTMATGILVWFYIPESDSARTAFVKPVAGMRKVFSQPVIWLQAVIVVCAYCGYKGLDNYALYAVEVLGMNEVDSARFTSISAYLRPVSAIAAGILVDRISARWGILFGFTMLILSYTVLAYSQPSIQMTNIIYANIFITFVAVFAIRGVYFALLEETNIPKHITGTAVGLISVIGFTPDVFFAAVAGRILDASPGVAGHQHFFVLLAVISLIGILTTFILIKKHNTVPIDSLH
jgi:nitrate/nitrite transporter NarK